ncbi:hypothetical protein P7D22_18715 [Lichenihabitans sp. Uapishka_5]|uniref:hypothetical protein n=1 Tax=Lichenihabitans sp. Uapishka_5 TaxID=3037302 RepID=UPI0029E813A8|nr:hypothetical protein [Lichenihabitans sp. Uapishka_5]MDX7953200.1 hypothetical protein [Lichenihabitans sp. Uapishka_5]
MAVREHPAPLPSIWGRTTILIAAAALFTLAWPLLHWGNPAAFDENGAVEGLQSIYLAIAVGLFLWAARHPAPLTRLPLAGIALFTFNLLIRETDVRGTWAAPYLGPVFLHGRMFYYLAGLWTALVATTCVALRPTAHDLIRWITGHGGIAMVTGCLLYVAGDVAEKHGFFPDAARSEALEESFELWACFAIMLSGWLTLRRPDCGARLGAP